MMSEQNVIRANLLRERGASDDVCDLLDAYGRNQFSFERFASEPCQLPLDDEPFVLAWQAYGEASRVSGVWPVLRQYLPQLLFPIAEGMSRNPAYQEATLALTDALAKPPESGIVLSQPDQLKLMLHPTFVGQIPVIVADNHDDFVLLTQALAMKNEARTIPASMGAVTVGGYNNTERLRQLRLQLQSGVLPDGLRKGLFEDDETFLLRNRQVYQDRFILLSDSPYSGVSAQELGLAPDDWRRQSLGIRLEHECTHYFTRRLLGSMKNNLFDELLADYMGLLAACGRYDASWFLRFLGLEAYPALRTEGRLGYYLGAPPLSGSALELLKELIVDASQNLENYTDARREIVDNGEERVCLLLALASLSLEELADGNASSRMDSALTQARSWVCFSSSRLI